MSNKTGGLFMNNYLKGSQITLTDLSPDEISQHLDSLSEKKDVSELSQFLDQLGSQEGTSGHVAYVRVSTVDQNVARQVDALRKYNIKKWFVEKISGKDVQRPRLQELLSYVREGDVVYIKDFSRLARNTVDLLNLVDYFKANHINLVSDKEKFDIDTPTGTLMLSMIAAINSFERALIRERQSEGIAIARREGKYMGRQKVNLPDFKPHYDGYIRHEESIQSIANFYGVSRTTVYRYIQKYKKNDPLFINAKKVADTL